MRGLWWGKRNFGALALSQPPPSSNSATFSSPSLQAAVLGMWQPAALRRATLYHPALPLLLLPSPAPLLLPLLLLRWGGCRERRCVRARWRALQPGRAQALRAQRGQWALQQCTPRSVAQGPPALRQCS